MIGSPSSIFYLPSFIFHFATLPQAGGRAGGTRDASQFRRGSLSLTTSPVPVTMMMKVYRDKRRLGRAAAEQAAVAIRSAIRKRGKARIIAATGSSQFECLEALTTLPGVSWEQVELFHLDEYIGLAPTASRELLSISSGASDSENGDHRIPLAAWRKGSGRGDRNRRSGLAGGACRPGVCRPGRERPPGVQ